MDDEEFTNFDPAFLIKDFNSRYRNFDMSDIENRVGQSDNDAFTLDGEFEGGEYAAPIPTTELDGTQRQLSTNGIEYELGTFANDAENLSLFSDEEQATGPSPNHSEQGTPYLYDKFGQLEGSEGYDKEVIEHYLCNHHFYGEGRNYKDCGLTLWIQRAPQIIDYLDSAPALCLYRDCCVNQSRHIQAGCIRVAFDEKTAPGHDPQINAGYVHLKCLETFIPYLRQMFQKLNFKVESRGPQINYSWRRNPTIFSTMNAIVYAEEYLEDCRKESRDGGRIPNPILLSAGIEKQFRSRYPAVREVERKILEMEGWEDMKALIDLKYPQACGTVPIASSIDNQQLPRVSISKSKGANRPNPYAYTKKKDHGSRGKTPAARRRVKYGSPIIEQYTPRSLKSSKRRHRKRDAAPKRKEPKITTEPQPLKKGQGKIKTRMFIRNGQEVWEKYEDLWSPLISDLEENTEDDDLAEDYEPKLRRERRLRGEKSKADKKTLSRDDEEGDTDEEEGNMDDEENMEDGDLSEDDKPKPRQKRRLGDKKSKIKNTGQLRDGEGDTEDVDLSEDDEPQPRRKRRLRGDKSKADKETLSRDAEDSRDDQSKANRNRRTKSWLSGSSRDDEDSGDDEPGPSKRKRSEEDYDLDSKEEEPRGHKRQRMYSEKG